MQLQYRHGRLEMLPENELETMFVRTLSLRVEDSNSLMSWYGDVEFGEKERSGCVITWQPDKDPAIKGIEDSDLTQQSLDKEDKE